MINLQNKQDCCGCSACVQKCPKQCITMQEDNEGFLYPNVDLVRCINCDLCVKVCPVIQQNEAKVPIETYAVLNPNEEIRMNSSSGGFFTLLAEKIIDEGGIVFGVGYNEHWEAAHSYTETKEGLSAFRTSKYIQSIVGNTYKEAEIFLKQKRKVLYTGTPCQIAGLKQFLRKDYDNLITMDFICHGTPSPGVFRWYLCEQLPKFMKLNKNQGKTQLIQNIPQIPKADSIAQKYGLQILGIRFRDKKLGWKRFSFSIDYSKFNETKVITYSETLRKNPFLRGFLNDLYLRPSCYHCPTKELKSNSDITIGDWWGIINIMPEIDDDKGVSAIIINSLKGKSFFEQMEIKSTKTEYKTLCRYNSAILQSSLRNVHHKDFFTDDGKRFFTKINLYCKYPLVQQIKDIVRPLLTKIKLLISKL